MPSADEAVKAKNDQAISTEGENLKKEIMGSDMHKWKSDVPKEELEKMINFYQKRYGNEGLYKRITGTL
jgi:hypothetical protein